MTHLKFALTAAALAFTAPAALAQDAATETAASQTLVTAKVNGMVCDFCARAVTKVFGKEEAVDNVHVDLDKGEIHVRLKGGEDMSDDRIGELVKKSGYDLVSIDREIV
ncbi:MAG: heavy-metal-associated domain-containing protein [Pseudomonadota bacterium]